MPTDRTVYRALAELVERHGGGAHRAPDQTQSLTAYELRVFSQNGEDGVLAELLARVGTSNRWFVEFGIETGAEGNCVFLADVLDWSGLLIEPREDAFAALNRKYDANDRVTTLRALVQPNNVEQLFATAGVPAEPDILSIDVDGNDYWIWSALTSYRPRIVVVEYNAAWPRRARWVQPYDASRSWDGTDNYGASLGALRSLGESKGYRLVHTELTGNNAFFVRRDLDGVLPTPSAVPERAPSHFLSGEGHPPHPQPAPEIIDLDAGE